MPITLGCPTCAKRFRAREESVGKRVKCPYCQAAIVVNADGTGSPGGDAPASRPAMPPAPKPVAAGDWGGDGGGPGFTAPQPTPSVPTRGVSGPQSKPSPRAAASSARIPPSKPNPDAKTPKQLALPGWKKTRSGLFWVLFGVVIATLPAFAEFGKLVYNRTVGDLPKGEGWVKIDGYVNTPHKDAVQVSKEEELQILMYGAPILLGGLMIAFGRMTAGAAPRASGAKGLFAFSGLFTLVWLVALGTAVVSRKLFFAEIQWIATIAFFVAFGLAEVWFLTGLASVGAHLKRPRATRGVGFLWFVIGLAVLVGTIGWDQYVKQVRPAKPDPDVLLYEAGGVMLGLLVVSGVYWQTIRMARRAISEWVDAVDD